MSNSKRDYDSTVARIAGNILSGTAAAWARVNDPDGPSDNDLAIQAVKLARVIVAETKRTEPAPPEDGGPR